MIKFFHIIINIKPIMNYSKTFKFTNPKKRKAIFPNNKSILYYIFQYESNDSQFGSQYSY